MAFSFRRLSKRFFATINVVLCLLLLLSVFQPYLNPDVFWFIGFMSIALPYLALVVGGYVLFWLFFDWRYGLISVITLLIGYQQIGSLFNLSPEPFTPARSPGTLRMMTWNVRSFVRNTATGETAPLLFLAKVRELSPDVVCFQEFGVMDKPPRDETDPIMALEDMGYRYHVLSRDYSRKKFGYSNGLAIFSKHPFAKTKRTPFTSSPESILQADVLIGKDTLQVYNTHLQSFKFNAENYRDIDRIQKGEDSLVEASRNIISKMKRAFRNRGAQSRQLESLLDSSKHVAVVCTDLNDVPNSYAYARLVKGRQDAFLQKGHGLGRTFQYLLPTLRIDYIFADKAIEVVQYHQTGNDISDHKAVLCDFQWPPTQR